MDSSPPPPWAPTSEDIGFVLGLVRKRIPRYPLVHEDLAQEVLLQATRSLTAATVEPRRLLTGIARNVVNDWLREQKGIPPMAEEEVEQLEDLATPAADQQLQAAERSHVLGEGLREVPGSYRDVVIRHELEDEPVADIARSLRVSIYTAYNRLRLGRRALGAALRRHLARRRIDKEDLVLPVPFFAGGLGRGATDGEESPARHWPSALESFSPCVAGVLAAAAVAALLMRQAPPSPRIMAIAETPAMTATTFAAPERQTVSRAVSAPLDPRGPGAPPQERGASPQGRRAPSSITGAPMSGTAVASAHASPGSHGAPSVPPTSPSDEAAWARRIRHLTRRGQISAAATESTAFRAVYPRSTLLLEP